MSFRLEQARIGCLLGPSGCGKTTALRAIAGFEPLQAGRIAQGGRELSTPAARVPPERREIGMVFQDLALFPHLTVAGNVGFALRRWSAAERADRVRELLALVGLAGRGDDHPHRLSGGEQQRVALARALAPRPRLLLLDEPFSSLDVTLRVELAREVRRVLLRAGTTAILVTHDQAEAFAVADEIGVLRDGRLLQWAPAQTIYHRPADPFVARFVGQGTLLPGVIETDGGVRTDLGVLRGTLPPGCAAGQRVNVLVRPDDVALAEAPSCVQGVVEECDFRGAEFLYTVRLDSGARVPALASSHVERAVGARIGLVVDMPHLVVFPAAAPVESG